MNFKPIKYLKNYSNYEMSDVGLIIRSKKDGSEAKVDKVNHRAELIGDDGTPKSFGLKTLYWKSWNRPIEEVDPTVSSVRGKKDSSEKKLKKEKKAKVAKSSVKDMLVARKGSLLSGLALKDLQVSLYKRKSSGNSPRGLIIYDGKTSECRVILHHEDSGTILVSMESSAPTRQGIWFMNPNTGKVVKFNKEVHKTGYGDANIIWPTL